MNGKKYFMLLVLVFVGLAACSNEEKTSRSDLAQDESGAFTEKGRVFSYDLRVGDCLDIESLSQINVNSVTVLPCNDVYTGYVYDQLELTDSETLPSEAELKQTAETFCLNSESVVFGDVQYIYPRVGSPKEQWEVSCIANAAVLPRDSSGVIDTNLDENNALYPFNLEKGDCFNTGQFMSKIDSRPASYTLSETVSISECDAGLYKQVFHTFELDQFEDYPGEEQINSVVAQECSQSFEGSDQDISWIVPNESAWLVKNLSRKVICFEGEGLQDFTNLSESS